MKKLKIGIDIDNVISDSYTAYLERFNKEFGRNIQYEELFDFYYLEKHTDINIERIKIFIDTVIKDNEFQLGLSPYKEAIAVINNWQRLGFSIHYITVRPVSIRQITFDWLKKHGFIGKKTTLDLYDEKGIYKSDVAYKKGLADKLKLDLFIEDAVEIARALTIPVLLLDRPWNRTPGLPKNVKRVKSWQEIEEHFSSWKND